MAVEVFANQAVTAVSSGGTGAPASGTVESWTVASSSAFPSAAAGVSQFHVVDTATGKTSEIILVTNVSGTTWTVTRGAESTTPVAHAAGFTIQLVTTAGFLGSLAPPLQPSGDSSGATDPALIQAAITAGHPLGPGTFYINTALTVDSQQVLAGTGPGTVIRCVSGMTGYMVKLAHPASTYQVTIENLALIPNTGTLGGVSLDNTGFTSGGGETDSLHVLENVYVQNAGGIGVNLGTNIRSLRMDKCAVYSSGSHGVSIASGTTDCSFTGNIVGVSGGHNWFVAGWNNYFASCKGFYAGYTGTFDTTHSCWRIDTNATNNTFVSCSAQNGALHGWDLQSCTQNAIIGCESDSNSAGGAIGGAGVNINNSTLCTIIGNVGANTGGTTVYGIQVAGTNTGTVIWANNIAATATGFNYVSGGGYFLISNTVADYSGLSQFKTIALQYTAAGVQALSNSSTISTGTSGILPVTETGNVTGVILAIPSNTNSQVTVVNRSNFTVTFAASGTSNVADGASDVIPALTARTFTYDSGTSLWYRSA